MGSGRLCVISCALQGLGGSVSGVLTRWRPWRRPRQTRGSGLGGTRARRRPPATLAGSVTQVGLSRKASSSEAFASQAHGNSRLRPRASKVLSLLHLPGRKSTAAADGGAEAVTPVKSAAELSEPPDGLLCTVLSRPTAGRRSSMAPAPAIAPAVLLSEPFDQAGQTRRRRPTLAGRRASTRARNPSPPQSSWRPPGRPPFLPFWTSPPAGAPTVAPLCAAALPRRRPRDGAAAVGGAAPAGRGGRPDRRVVRVAGMRVATAAAAGRAARGGGTARRCAACGRHTSTVCGGTHVLGGACRGGGGRLGE